MPKLSVVVPFFNVEAYIGRTLESIAKQTLQDFEVITVDDGSADGSAVIVKSFAARDPRFRLIEQSNQGLGPARNTGVRHAVGKYLAFADSDDLLAPHAYQLLVGSLERTGSDIASGGVARFNSSGMWTAPAHGDVFNSTLLRTHVTRYPLLLQDRTAWNKVFRRSFWNASGLEFPGRLYEDAPVMIRAHVLARSTDVFDEIVYYWRMRESGELSITQRARELSNLEDRIASLHAIGAFLADHAPAIKPVYDRFALNIDMATLFGGYELANEADRERMMELATGYLRTVDDAAYRDVDAIKRLNCYLMRRGMRDELLEVLRYWRRGDGARATIVRRGGRRPTWYISHPYFGDPARGIPDRVYDVTNEMKLLARLDAVTWREGRLCIEGHGYIRGLSSASPNECQIRVMLRNASTRRTLRLPVERIARPDVTAQSGQAATCYDWSGFAVEIAPRKLATLGCIWRAASWELRVEVSGNGMRRQGPINGVAPGSAQWPEGRWLNRSVWIQAAPEHDGRFVLRGRLVKAFVTGCRSSGDALEIDGWTTFPLTSGAILVIAPRKGGVTRIRIPVRAAQSGVRGRHAFSARVPLAEMIRSAEAASPIDTAIHVHDQVIWDVSIKPGDEGAVARLTISPSTAGARTRLGGREVTAFVTHFGYLSLIERTRRPVVSQLEWTSGTQHGERLVLRGDYLGPANRPAELVLRHSGSGDQCTIPLTWQNDVFTAELTPGKVPGMAGELPLASGNWNLLARTGDGEPVTVAVDHHLLPRLPGYHPAGMHEVEPQAYRTDALRLNIRVKLAEDERGWYAQQQLSRHHYTAAMGRPLRDLVIFDSFGGLHYSCNPRMIYEELRRSHPDLESVWVTRDGQFLLPNGCRAVVADSRAHYDALAQARYIVTNNLLPEWYIKRDGQVCMQTWHGTPLKRIGLEIEQPAFSNGIIYKDLLRQNVRSWDVLLSQNEFSTPIFRRAFAYEGEIAETGYPRNDPLHQQDRAARAAAVRDQLGLPADRRIVLYAPTWRDDAFQGNGIYRFDLRLNLQTFARALGGDHILLLRLHTNVRNGLRARLPGSCVINVTRYPDIADLYLVSDVLITDYSSAMFDFAGTGRPILFFTYDLERYRDQLRGFYFDFEAEAPGSLLRTSDEVIAALRDIGQVKQTYQQKQKDFAANFCALDDGRAAARAVDRLLAGR